jgi:hypothetical protein
VFPPQYHGRRRVGQAIIPWSNGEYTRDSELAPVVAMDTNGAAHRPLSQGSHFAGGKRSQQVGRPCDVRAQAPATAARRRRYALCAAFLRAQLVFETLTLTDCRGSSSASYSGSCSPMDTGSSTWTVTERTTARQTHQATATHVEGEGRWNRCCPVEANPAPLSPSRCRVHATRAERNRASQFCCRARAVSVSARPWVRDAR